MKAKILKIILTLVVTIVLSSQVLAQATCGDINSFPGPVEDSTSIVADDFTETAPAIETDQTANVAAGVNPSIVALSKACSDAARSISDPYRISESTACYAVNGEMITYTDESDDYVVNLIASADDVAVKANIIVIDKDDGSEVCSNTITPNSGTIFTGVTVTDAEKIYLTGNILGAPTFISVTELSSLCAAVAVNTITDTTPATSIYSYPYSTVLTPNGDLAIGMTRGADEGIILFDPVLGAINDYNTYGMSNVEGVGLRLTVRDTASDELVLTTIGYGGGGLNPNLLDMIFVNTAAGVLTLSTSMRSSLHVGFDTFLTVKDVKVDQTDGDVLVGGELQLGDGTNQGYGALVTFAGALTFIDRVTSTSVINEINSVDIISNGNDILIGGDNTNTGQGGIIRTNGAGAKLGGYSGNFLVGDVAFLKDFDNSDVVGVGTSEFGEPGMTLLPLDLNSIKLRVKHSFKGNVPMNQAPLVTVDLNDVNAGTVDWLVITAMDAGFGIQIYGINPNPDVPEFSLTTLLLATLLAGGLVLFVVRRRYK